MNKQSPSTNDNPLPVQPIDELNASEPVADRPIVDREIEKISKGLALFLDCSPVPTFVLNAEHTITHWNKACEHVLGFSSEFMLSTKNQWMPFYRSQRPVLADLVLHNEVGMDLFGLYGDKVKPSFLANGACEVDAFFENLGNSGLWLHFTAAPLINSSAAIIGSIQTLEDITERKEAEKALRLAHSELELLVKNKTAQLADANNKLILDISEREAIETQLIRRNHDLTELNTKLYKAQYSGSTI